MTPIGRVRRLVITVVLCAAGLIAQGELLLAADDAAALEQRVKAAFLYQFAGYVEWPEAAFPQPGAPLTIAVSGSEAMAAELSQVVTGRTVNGRPIVVKSVKPDDALDGSHVLFIAKGQNVKLSDLAQRAQRRSVLTVTEAEGALAQGSVINFVLADRRVRFEISLDAADKSKLKLSSRLLAVAQQVKGAP